jgi:hypothetical protein
MHDVNVKSAGGCGKDASVSGELVYSLLLYNVACCRFVGWSCLNHAVGERPVVSSQIIKWAFLV